MAEVVRITITGDSKSYQTAADDAKHATDNFNDKLKENESQTPKTTSGLEKLSSKLENLGSKMQSLGTKMSIGLTVPLTLAGKTAINSASDYEENLNKIDVAFGDSSKVVTNWGNNALKQFGLSKNQALESAALFGDMATSMGLSQSSAADMSMSLSGLAGDLSSFKNIGVDQAMTALNGVFTGETESLKTLGIVMTDTNLNAYALEKGFGKTTDQMSQAEKVQLRYAYVMDMTKNAQGDYARTSDGTANSMRTFQGTVDNLMIALGEKLLPVFTPLIQGATGLVESFANADPAVQGVVIGVGALLAVGGPLLIFFGSAAKGISSMITLYGTLKESTMLSTIATKAHTLATNASNLVINSGKAIVTGVTTAFTTLKNAHLLSKASTIAMTAATTIWNGVSTAATAVTTALGAAFTFLTSPIGLVILVIGAVIAIGYLLIEHWDEVKAFAVETWDNIEGVFQEFDDFLTGIFSTDWTKSFGAFGEILNAFSANASNICNGIKQIFTGIIDFIKNVFTGNWSGAWQAVINIFGGIFDTIVAVVKSPINLVIGLINGMISGVESGVNFCIDGLNKLSFDVPDWVPIVGGEHWGFDVGHVGFGRIDYLLHGTDNWQGGFARMNEGGRGELTYLPNGTQVIPHDISVKYAQEAARSNNSMIYVENESIDYDKMTNSFIKAIKKVKVVLNDNEIGEFIDDRLLEVF